MATPIFPITRYQLDQDHRLKVDRIINSFGDAFEQRIVTSLARGPRADGEGTQTIYVGRNIFSVGIPGLLFRTQPISGNPNLDNSVEKVWRFYKERYYDSGQQIIKDEPFFIYQPQENDDFSTWLGDSVAAGTNSRGEAVTNLTGRYLVRFQDDDLSKVLIKRCLSSFALRVIEVAA